MEQSPQRAQARVRVMVLGLGAIAIFLSAVGLFLYLKPGGNSPTPEELPVFVAGPLDGFEPGTVSYFEIEHVYVVRMPRGSLLAIYDLAPSAQVDVRQGDESALECRIEFIEDENGFASLGDPPRGFEEMVFWDPCEENAWDAAGSHLFGSSGKDLDRFPFSVVDGVVRVDVNDRRCLNEVGPAAPCIPTQ